MSLLEHCRVELVTHAPYAVGNMPRPGLRRCGRCRDRRLNVLLPVQEADRAEEVGLIFCFRGLHDPDEDDGVGPTPLCRY